MNKMSCFLQSRSTVCGDSRGVSGLFCLLDCDDSIESHLASIHLSRENLTEKDLILARAGIFDLEDSVIGSMFVCAKHRHTYGKYWRSKTYCQYPSHQGRPGRGQGVKSRYSINLDMAKAIYHMYGVLVCVGSGAYLSSFFSLWNVHSDTRFLKEELESFSKLATTLPNYNWF